MSLRLWKVGKVMCVVTRAMRVMTETQVGGASCTGLGESGIVSQVGDKQLEGGGYFLFVL